jgi:uncharacterized protein with GYD domain
MAKYLLKVSYTKEGVQGVLKEGGSKRREVVNRVLKDLGGTLDAFYFAFGDADVFTIVDLPDAATMAAVSLAVAGTGAAKVSTVPLLTPEEIDAATKKSVSYRAPGS